ncbi:TetR/AcrR family transcriptional regulator [Nonomuraea sp. SYSU D8015]|uniref:TetR/AcrR family transcriptional regulator n=1 Tax=Nonomuraea sp. SYSU D8015 TaxID=2593644 RepID=UPI001660462A|nr:TetR/AcrR family transcriptional regulator [Nonomuraea sp. SYSU D8015]
MQPESCATNQDRRSFIEQARRHQIVGGAIEALAELGYARASFTRIAERAGVSPALISYHFASKEELLEQVVTNVVESMRTASVQAEEATSYAEALRIVIESQVRYFADHRTETAALQAIRSAAGTAPSAAAWAARNRSLVEFQNLLEGGQRVEEFGDFPPRVMAAAILASLEAVPAELRAQPDADAGDYARELAALFDRATRRAG